MKKQMILVVLAVGTLAGACSYTERTTATTPAPVAVAPVVVPAQTTQQTNYRDSYTGKPLASETVVTTRQ